MEEKVDSIIFDMDGTLWDAVLTYSRAWNKYYRQTGIERILSYEELGAQMGVEEKKFLEFTMPHIPKEQRSTEYSSKVVPLICSFILEVGGSFYSGVINGLNELSIRYKLFIVSNCPAGVIDCFMQCADIYSIIKDNIAHGQNFKSKSENIKLLIDKHKLQHAVYVGDTNSDSLQSEIAGVPFIFVDYGFGKTNQYKKKFSNFLSLVEWFCKEL